MRQYQRPGGERHEFPSNKKAEGVVGDDDEIHPGEIGGKIGQYAQRRGLVAAIAEAVERCGGTAEIDHDQKESGERVDAEMRADKRQADRQRHLRSRGGTGERLQRGGKRDQADGEAGAINDGIADGFAADRDGEAGNGEKGGDAAKPDNRRHPLPSSSAFRSGRAI